MEISPLQSIRFYGLWDQPRRVLVWEDITAKCYSWRRLRQEIGLTPTELMTIQPSPQEWVNRGALQLADLPDMVCFPVNPFTHLNADLAEVWGMRWSSELLSDMKVTYDQLRAKGMNVHVIEPRHHRLSSKIGHLRSGIRGIPYVIAASNCHNQTVLDRHCLALTLRRQDRAIDIDMIRALLGSALPSNGAS